MSHFIQNTPYIQTQPIFSVPIKQIVVPKLSGQKLKILKNKSSKDSVVAYCKKLQQKQYETLLNQNQQKIQIKYRQLKKKMFKNISQQQIRNIFDKKEEQRLNIKKIQQMKSKKVQIQKKYPNQILHKIQAFKQAQQINRMKSAYTTWYDNTQNDRGKSPILKKVIYLLQRAQKQNILDSLNLRNSHKQLKQIKLHNKSLSKSTHIQKYESCNQIRYKKRKLRWTRNKSELPFRQKIN